MELGEEPPDPNLPQYHTIKTSLSQVLKLPQTHEKIQKAVFTIDKIIARSLMFLKMYLIHIRHNPPIVDDTLLDTIFKTMCKESSQGRPPTAKMKAFRKPLTTFYNEHFKPLLPENDKELSYKYLSTPLDYAAKQFVTVFETNVKCHYVEYVESYVNAAWHKYDLIERIKRIKRTKTEREAAIRKLNNVLRDLKTDLLNVGKEPLRSHVSYHDWITSQKRFVLPIKESFEKDLIYYDIHCHPQQYYPCMLWMTNAVEQLGGRPKNFCPLRTSLVPKHITLDTASLVHLLFEKEIGLGDKKTDLLVKGGLVRNQQKIWDTFFRTNKRPFKGKHFTFNHTIQTDGVSCCVLLIRKDLSGKQPASRQRVLREQYIDDLSADECLELSPRTVVGIDPNMSDLLYCTNEDASKRYRYTQDQRRMETRSKRYARIKTKEKRRTTNRVEGRSIEEWETVLSSFNHRSVNFERFKEYVKNKLLVTSKIETFYRERIFRKLKLGGYWNTRYSEMMLLKRFEEIFGAPNKVVIGIGDWEQKKHRKFKEPVKGKGFRSVLRKGGYKVFLVDEFRTSCKCSYCQHEEGKCETFRIRLDPNRKKRMEDRHLRKVHGLLACKMCKRLWNRDVNSAINTARLTRERLEGRERPQYMSRKSQGVALNSAVTSTA